MAFKPSGLRYLLKSSALPLGASGVVYASPLCYTSGMPDQALSAHLSPDDVRIVLEVKESRSYAHTASALGLTEGRIKHRFFRSLRILEAVGQAGLITLPSNTG